MSDDEIIERIDIPIRSHYQDVPINGSMTLYEGMLPIQRGDTQSESHGRIHLALQGTPCIRFETTLEAPVVPIKEEIDAERETKSFLSSMPFISQNHIAFRSMNKSQVSGRLNRAGLTVHETNADGKPESVGRVQFHLINFLEYWGSALYDNSQGRVGSWSGRVIFCMDKWEITLDQFRDIESRLEEAEALNGNVLTHIGVIRRIDNKLFDPNNAVNVLDALRLFLSFMNGSRCAIVSREGFRHLDHPLWQHWKVHPAAFVNSGRSWFSKSETQDCFQAADKFYTCWCDPDKQNWLVSAIGIYLASNSYQNILELDLANSQALLEMLTWVALLEENALMSDASFDKVPAPDKIRALLFWLGIPCAIPEGFIGLKSAFPSKEAPEAIVMLRNMIVHPSKKNRAQRQQISLQAIGDAWQLSLWYAELTLFKLLGYSGYYDSRVGNPHSNIGSLPPWATGK